MAPSRGVDLRLSAAEIELQLVIVRDMRLQFEQGRYLVRIIGHCLHPKPT